MIVCGIDEAGYGPLLGPLCVALSVFRVDGWSPGDPAPDLWELLSSAVAREPNDAKGRLPVADSKRLKLSNSLKTKHPLTHLERSVLAFARTLDWRPADDDELFEHLGAEPEPHPWYAGSTLLPLSTTHDRVGIEASRLRRAMKSSGVELLELRCAFVGEQAFNDTVARTHSKAETTIGAVGSHLRRVRERWGGEEVRVICDRLGGRLGYGELIGRAFGDRFETLEQSARASRYRAGLIGVTFMPEAEDAHLPVALASMVAKLVRELAMTRFNAYWTGRMPGLRRTAGYRQDAKRWLGDAEGVIGDQERATMVRLA